MSDIVHTLRRELAALEGDVVVFEADAAKAQARLRLALDKADKIKSLISLYGDDLITDAQPRLFAAPITPQPQPNYATPGVARTPSKAALIKLEISELLAARGTEHRGKLLEHLIAKGLMGHEKNPMASLAAYLSDNKDTFVADGRGNFSLRRESRREPPPAPVNGVGSAEDAGSPAPSPLTQHVLEGGVS